MELLFALAAKVHSAVSIHTIDVLGDNSAEGIFSRFARGVQILADAIDQHLDVSWQFMLSSHTWLLHSCLHSWLHSLHSWLLSLHSWLLSHTRLSHARLLSHTRLSHARLLSHTRLLHTWLSHTRLLHTGLHHTRLLHAWLLHTRLHHARLSHAWLHAVHSRLRHKGSTGHPWHLLL